MMKAILQYEEVKDGKLEKNMLLFDTEKAKKVMDIRTPLGAKAGEIYISFKGILFMTNIKTGKLEICNQEKAKLWIAEENPEKYMELFGSVEEA